MRTLLIVLLVVALLILVGWITFSRGPGRSSVNIETEKIQEDTQTMVESGARAIDRVQEAVDGSDTVEETPSAEPAPAPAPMNPDSDENRSTQLPAEPTAPADSVTL